MSDVVLDASALLAALHEEAGGDKVEPLIGRSVISTVNWSEVVQKSMARGVWDDGVRDDLQALGLVIRPFAVEDAEIAAAIYPKTKSRGLSLGDRACLAVGLRLKLPVLTTDRAWKGLGLVVDVRVVR